MNEIASEANTTFWIRLLNTPINQLSKMWVAVLFVFLACLAVGVDSHAQKNRVVSQSDPGAADVVNPPNPDGSGSEQGNAIEGGSQQKPEPKLVDLPLDESLLYRALLAQRAKTKCGSNGNADDVAGESVCSFLEDPLRQSLHPEDGNVPTVEALRGLVQGEELDSGSEQNTLIEPAFSVGGANTFSGLSEREFLEGATAFLIERAKDELALRYLRRIRAYYDEQTLIGDLFPATKVILDAVDDLGYKTLLPSLQTAFRSDLENLPITLTNPTLKYKSGGTENSLYGTDEVKKAVLAAHVVARHIQDVRTGEPVVQALAGLSDWPSQDVLEWVEEVNGEDLVPRIRLIGLLAREIEYLAQIEDVDLQTEVLKPDVRKFFIAFTLHRLIETSSNEDWKEEAAKFADTTRREYKKDAFGDLAEVSSLITRIYGLVEQTNTTPGEKVDRVAVIRSSVRLWTSVFSLAVSTTDDEASLQRVSKFLNHATELLVAIEAENYSKIALVGLQVVKDARESSDPNLTRMLTFGAALAEADSSEQVTAALEAAADPVGSFRARRGHPPGEQNVNVAVVAYLGGSGGLEWTQVDGTPRGAHAGVAAPIGIEFSIGTNKAEKSFWPLSRVRSVGLQVSLLDLGTLVNYRLSGEDLTPEEGEESDAEVDANPAITFAHVFSPGAHLVFGLGDDSPISFGLGVQYAPRLRDIEGGTLQVSEVDAIRASAFLAVDLTLFRF